MTMICDYAKVSPIVLCDLVLREYLTIWRDIDDDRFEVTFFSPVDAENAKALVAPYLF